MKLLRKIFRERLTRVAGIVLLLIVAIIIFDLRSPLPKQYPLFGVFNFALVPALVVLGGIIFFMAIRGLCDIKQHPALPFLMVGGALGIVLLVVGVYQLVDFTDSTAFCGRLCHQVMDPEYTAYQGSPHSRVTCAQCHVGSGVDYLVKSKISGVPMIYSTITGHFERPIPTPVKNLRPARETCEQCHRPERFAGDVLRVHTTFSADETNTRHVLNRGYRVGGGELGDARDIHWHIGATVSYVATDEKRQNIVWVGVQGGAYGLVEYTDPSAKTAISPADIEAKKRLMDCMDCHNRATHVFRSPDELIDTALAQGTIDVGLPFIKREGLKALDPQNPSLEQAFAKVEGIRDFYKSAYPAIATNNTTAVDQAIVELKDIARQTTFPGMNLDWNSYLSNLGHLKSPGCFRCHGKLQATSGPNQGQTIKANCELCHYNIENQ